MTIGDKLLAARQAARLTQQDVADRVGVTKQTIFKYENGIITNIPIDRLVAIAQVLEVDPAEIMGWAQDKSANNSLTNGDFSPYREQLRRQPGARTLLDAAADATDEEIKDWVNVINIMKKYVSDD